MDIILNKLRSTIETRFVKGSAIALMSGVALVGCSNDNLDWLYASNYLGEGFFNVKPLSSCLKGNDLYDPAYNASKFRKENGEFVVTPFNGGQELIFQNIGDNILEPSNKQTALVLKYNKCRVGWEYTFEDE